MSMQLDFWIPFREAEGGVGGVGLSVQATTVEDAITEANLRAVQAMKDLEHNDAAPGIFFATNTPFSAQNLCRAECVLDSEGVDRLQDEPVTDFLPRIVTFLSQHPDEHDQEG